MSAEAQVARLESLLERVQARRRPLGGDAEPDEELDASRRAAAPTPMEQALSVELEAQEPELEIVVDEDEDEQEGPVITIVPDEDEETAAAPPDEGAPLSEDVPPLAAAEAAAVGDLAPTAPVGTRAPAQEPPAPRPGPSAPRRIEQPAAQASGPVAKVVSRPAARTFGEVLERTLALRVRAER